MNKGKIISKYRIEIIDYDYVLESIKEKKKSELISLDNQEYFNEIDAAEKSNRIEQIESAFSEKVNELNDYKEFRLTFPPIDDSLNSFKPYYEENDGIIIEKWEVIENDPERLRYKIDSLKQELSDGDYKITKCYEASLLGAELPYDVQQLHENRQALRCEINELEVLLNS